MKTVLVQHRSVVRGEKAYLEKTKGIIRRVVAMTDDGEVKDHVGEVWKVKASSGKADFETVSSTY